MERTSRSFWDKRWKKVPDINRIENLKWMRSYLYRRLDKILKNELEIDPGHTFLEAGCGLGRWLVYFHNQFKYKVYGIDYSEEGCNLARRVLEKSRIESIIYFEDVFNFKKRKFDIVFSDGFIEHFDDITKTIGHISSLVKHGGYLISIIPNLTGFQDYLLSRSNKKNEILKSHNAITKEELINSYIELKYIKIKFYELGSIIPKVFALPGIISNLLNIFFLLLDFLGVHLEGEKISSTYLIIGEKSGTDYEKD